MIALGFMDANTALLAIIILVFIEMSFGPTVGGFYKCAAIVARWAILIVLNDFWFYLYVESYLSKDFQLTNYAGRQMKL
jgi:hypothetical protein